MSWTKRQYVEQAFDELALAGYVFTLTPDLLQSALRQLDSMIAFWETKGIAWGYPFADNPKDSDLDTDTLAPRMADEAVYKNLAIKLAPNRGKTLSIDTKADAKASLSALMGLYNKPVSRRLPTTMPRGQGSKYWRWYGDPFIWPEEATESNIEIV